MRFFFLKTICLLLLLFFLYPTFMELFFTNKEPLSYAQITDQPEHLTDARLYNGEVLGGYIRYAWDLSSFRIYSIQGLLNPYWSDGEVVQITD